ncbi:hypothetical protein OCU04_001022 [Sclerotinia nivalis]|uniref:Glucose-methanol-choline oxidoreductase N-terminal domain-containing protein n=1 Tax=Sclerotinia nivalis TaxID=352851 RepID=A0A9X0DNZ5_9HELO|nr:hypothetical protein OCU04_001022 [Sclerotinia nivalis]
MVLESARVDGYREIDDRQDPTASSSIGVAKWQRYISPDGIRQDTATVYLHSLLNRDQYPNLHVMLKTKVSKVLFDGDKHTTGVEYYSNGGDSRIVVKKLAILAAGALGTPQILERSGIGGATLLNSLDIPVVSELNQMGENYQIPNIHGINLAMVTLSDTMPLGSSSDICSVQDFPIPWRDS